MKFSWIFALINFLTLFAVDDGGGAVDETATDQSTTDTSDIEEPPSLGDEVWDEISSNDGASEESATDDSANEEGNDSSKEEPAKKEEAAPEAKDEKQPGITDDDLKPLESKNPATNERFQKITEGYKAEKTRADALAQENERFKGSFESLKQLGFNDENAANDLVEFAAYRNLLYSGNAEQFKGVLEAQIKQFELMHGKRIQVSASALDAYPELKQKVSDLELDEDTAIEVARARSVQERAGRDAQARNQAVQTETQRQQSIDSAVSEVTSLQSNWQSTDPDYQAVLPHLQPLMTEIGRTYPPHLWASTIDIQYKALKKALATNVRQASTTQPLRGNGYMSGKPAPTNTQEAVLQAMGFDD
jgi:hypothetical protein